jgi:peptide/nickel transport system substrate-binding protein/oligopeptide transport system substrate-binding protein
MTHKLWLKRTVSALALAAMVLGAAGLAGARHASAARPAALYHQTAHVLNYPNVGLDWPDSFDPANVEDSQSIQAVDMLYANLVKLNVQNQVVPDLARSWDVSPNRKVYTFHLRTDARFFDGHPITADDVIYSIDRALNPHVYKGGPSPVATTYLGHIVGATSYKGLGDVKGLKKIDAHTVQITIDSPISFFLQTLTYWTADVLEKGKTPMGGLTTKNPLQHQISSGPWKLSKFRYRSSLTFVPNPGWYNYNKMKLREVDMPFVSTSDTAYQGYESGQYAMGPVSPSSRLPAARKQPDFHSIPNLAIDYISYNFAKPPFNNKALRLAATYAINRELIDSKVWHGAQVPLYGIVPMGIPGYDPDGKKFTPSYNPGKAKMYLAMARKQLGKSFPSSLTIVYQNTSSDIRNEYTELAYEWQQVGLNVKLQGVTFNTWLRHVTKPTLSLTYKGGDPWVEQLWIDDYPDAQDFTTNLLAPSSYYNVGNYNNPQFESLITRALTARGSERVQLYITASRIALNDAAWSMVGQTTSNWRWHQNIKGMTMWSGEIYPVPVGRDWTNADVQ